MTNRERTSEVLSLATLQLALIQFHKDGIVVLKDVVEHASLDHIRERMMQDLPRNLASPHVHYNHGTAHRNVSQTPPLAAEYLHERVWANRLVVNIIEHIIGPKPQLSFVTSNLALPGGQGRQAVHSDYYCEHLDFPVFLEVCIFLEDVDNRNGSTEIWPGTHRGYTKKDHTYAHFGWIKKSVFSQRARMSPPAQLAISKGSVCLRDLRMWHAGMPNHTATPRIMLGFMFSPAWFKSEMRLRMPMEAKVMLEAWEHVDCLSATEFVENDMDYLEFRQEIILTQGKRVGEEKDNHDHGRIVPGKNDYWEPPGTS
ncbi:hypothetical protein CC86DRAFT_407995 [Ophiobolus disseminans]|uniref:Phytanoyl-CoA dioxygenase family protein n=1 Tax=Ophiobolus disseminans TaxID=1469910 RepID=A0A6A6ZWZ4_9PLEO|nr:hypothetical protein CC86DRAFT_407995 [Ophiobolus disseminans]